MKIERFSELWDALVKNRPKAVDAAPITNGMREETAEALIQYSNGDKTSVEKVKQFLATPAA